MSETEIEDEFQQIAAEIDTLKANVPEDEQNFLDSWISKITHFETDEGKSINFEYLRLLRSQMVRDERRLSLPFLAMPPDSDLIPLREYLDSLAPVEKKSPSQEAPAGEVRRRYIHSHPDPKPPCRPKTRISKPMKRQSNAEKNEFEDLEEMAKCIARSKGKMLPDFVADISRYTSDKGRKLRTAMKEEVTAFSEHVQRIISQRDKDVTELMVDKQNQELLKIQKKYDQWQSELSLCKMELKAIVPDFDLSAYRKDENYLRKLFTVSSSNSPVQDNFKEWKEEHCYRLMFFSNEVSKLMEENNQILREIAAIKIKISDLEQQNCLKEQEHGRWMRLESIRHQFLKKKSDKLAKEITDLLISQEN